MRKSDIISIILVAMIGTFAAGFIVNLLLGNPDDAKETYKDISVVDATLADPDPEMFNMDAINPTIEVYVGNCEDVDQDGVLSKAELAACGRTANKNNGNGQSINNGSGDEADTSDDDGEDGGENEENTGNGPEGNDEKDE